MDPKSFREKYPPEIRDWWENVLKSPRYVVAPMVDASELAWRMLSRRYKADLCYTPMIHSRIFTEEPKYRNDNLFNCLSPEDRPLLVQFCGNDPDVMVLAASLAKPVCDGIDLNLGCPQKIARNGHYGAFLMEDWDLISTIVRRIHDEVKVPISCKIRIFPDLKKTIEYAKMLERSGASLITVHGRTREQKGMDTGLADWTYIKAVREAVNIPVLANGNIQFVQDAERCIAETGVEGVMSAEGNLYNPALYAGKSPPVWEMGLEYLELVEKYPCPLSYARGHMFKLYHHLFTLPENADIRRIVAKADELKDLMKATILVKERYECYVKGEKEWVMPIPLNPDLPELHFPHYLCQPYVRPPKKPHVSESNDNVKSDDETNDISTSVKKRRLMLPESLLARLDPNVNYSNNKLKKMAKKPDKNWEVEAPPHKVCSTKDCTNLQGQKCAFQICKPCCRLKCYKEELDCVGHRLRVKSIRAKAREYERERLEKGENGKEVKSQ